MWQETLKKKKRTIRSKIREDTTTAPLCRLNNIWFIVTKKDVDTGNSSKFLISYEAETGHYFCLGSSEPDLVFETGKKIERLGEKRILAIIDAYKKENKSAILEIAQGNLF
jgi:hypothetical protein